MNAQSIAHAVQLVTGTVLSPVVLTAREWVWKAKAMNLRTRTPRSAVLHFAQCHTGVAHVWWKADGSATAFWVDSAGRMRSQSFSERDMLRITRTLGEVN